MRFMSRLWPHWQSNRRREARQSEEKNRARSQLSDAVMQLERRTHNVNRIAEDAIKSMHRGNGK